MKVSRDQGCLRGLSWRLELAPGLSLERFRASLEPMWVDRTTMASVWRLESLGGHQLVVVPSTGRIQLRVHYTVARERRSSVAQGLAKALADDVGDPYVLFDAELDD